MNLLDKVIGYFSPGSALKRVHARNVLTRIQRSYNGAETTRLSGKRNRNQSADQELMGPFGGDALRAGGRESVRNNAYAWNVVDTLVSTIIGDGITAQSTYETKEGEDIEDVNDIRDKTWEDWCKVCDINGRLHFVEMQELAQREMAEAGEVLIRKIRTPRKEFEGIMRPVPLALEMIEADRLALDHDTYISRTTANRVVRGIEMDYKGKPIAYWIYPEHPNAIQTIKERTPERVPANEIIHLFRQERVGQSRGASWLHPSMAHLRDLGIYIDNELQSSAVAACFGVAVKTETPMGSLADPDEGDTTDAVGNTFEHIEPGMVTRLGVNESIECINPGRPNAASEPWISLLLRGVAAGTGTSYEAISKDFSKTSYSSSRTSKLEDRPRTKRAQNYIVWHFCQNVWDAFCDQAAVAGLESFPTSTELLEDRTKYAPVEWQRPELEWVDVSAEQKSAESALATFTDTYQNVLGGRGMSYRSVFYQRAKEDRLRKKLGLLTEAERTQEMMAAQTVNNAPQETTADTAAIEMGTSEMMGLSTQQWNRNRKAIGKILDELANGVTSAAAAKVFLSSVGMSPANVDVLIADATDGKVDTALPADVSRSIVRRTTDYKREFSSTQFNFNAKDSSFILDMAARIPDSALAKDGREDEPHITIKYGLHDDSADLLREVVASFPIVHATLGKTTVFPANESQSQRGGEQFDVVKIDVESHELRKLNSLISESLENTDTHPEYHPHVTLAYVKPGLGAAIAKSLNNADGMHVVFDKLVFSGKDKTKIQIRLGQSEAVNV